MKINFLLRRGKSNRLAIPAKLVLTMKLVTLLLMATLSQVTAIGYSQKISLEKRNVSIEAAFKAIENQTDYLFLYDKLDLPPSRLVSVSIKNATIDQTLTQLFQDLPLSYKIFKKNIVIKKEVKIKEESVVAPMEKPSFLQALNGKVTDEKGEGLPGVNIVIKGTSKGATTNTSGEYQIDITDKATVLVFSFVGYLTQELEVGNRTTLDVTLKVDDKALEEVVVVGYGTQKKSDLTGAISSIKAEDLKKLPTTSFDQAIQGRAAGVQVTQASSAPGGRVSIRIRGGNSLSSGNEPLYVIDGYPITAGGTAGGNGAGQNPLASINPSDIASMEILKDASATAIYGSRGANGVVLVTTKRGKAGKTSVTYDGYYGVQKVIKKLDLMNAREFATLVNEARANDGVATPVYPNPADLYNFPDPATMGEGVDYQDEIFRSAAIQNHTLNISGGNDNTKIAVSGSYFDQKGVLIGSDFKRASIRANIDTKLSKNIMFSTNLTGSKVWGNNGRSEGDGGGNANTVNAALIMPPTVPIFQKDGTYTRLNPTPGGSTVHNPVPIVLFNKDFQNVDRLMGTMAFTWNIISDLSLKVSVGTDMSNANRETYEPRETVNGYNANGRAGQANRRSMSYLNENILTYNKAINKHLFNVVAGYTRQMDRDQLFSASSSNFLTDLYEADKLDAGAVFASPVSWKNQSQLVSYLGRINYTFNNKYLLSLTGRSDGSSKFGANNKWAFFPSVAVGYRLSEEKFIQSIDAISNLKVRASFGKTGNQNIENYRSLARLNVYNYDLSGALVSGLAPGNIANPDLRWETTATTDVGIDLDLFGNRLNFVADYYYKKTTDLLWNVSVPQTSGFASIFRNIGSLQNKGLELSLGGEIFVKEFKWNSQLNWSMNRNKVLDIPGYTPTTQNEISGHLKINGSWLEPGLPVGVWNLLQYDGVFQNQEQFDKGPRSAANDKLGDARFIDRNGNGSINLAEDRMIVGDPNPDFIYGWSNNFSYKGFDLSVYMQGTFGNDILNVQRAESNVSGPWGNQRKEIVDRWTPTNTTSNIPRARVTVNPLLLQSSWLIEDGSFLRVKTASLGYTFKPSKGISSCRVYVTGQNLLTFTKYSGFDPEVNSPGNSNLQLGVDYNAYPAARTFLVGVNVGF
ncbi:TonB-linked outer membrane protein, SusC/RagA family [Dyadobacter koreensis]|uniref:TonB-linked outer membrane protein, SusC/RagA family n=1 Tax=Dyadobacter koreensis TaxID=408657 RepID=A0A1H6YJ29_9BACT|nr:TonB-dependent receptor [Dyadobacter koreensis]SEJ39834.1 TonB-linked outer membrane protein, SusC/RagA family [Dyadobacter koreensis]